MHTSPIQTPAPAHDPILVALLLACALHALLILGVSFAPPDPAPQPKTSPVIDITVLPRRNTPPPDEADYLAEASQQGGGNVSERVEPTPPQTTQIASAPPPPAETEKPRELVAQKAPRKATTTPTKTGATAAPEHNAPELINRSMELLSLDQQLRQSMQAYSSRPRQTFITASTREFKYASYMNAWVAKVERLGNLNYPDEARRRGLSGSLLLDVALNADGSVANITVRTPSGHPELDQAAIRIVRQGAPYAPFPSDIREDTDILHITRTWEFLDGSRLQSQ